MKKTVGLIMAVLLLFSLNLTGFSEECVDNISGKELRRKRIMENFLAEVEVKMQNIDDIMLKEGEGTYIDIESYPSACSIGETVAIKGTPLFTEPDKGAHYYAFSPNGTDYKSIDGFFELPTVFNNANNTRNAYISVGVGNVYGIDFGIRNTGAGWHPYYYEVNPDDEKKVFVDFNSEEYTAGEEAVCASFFVYPYKTDSVIFAVYFYDDENDESLVSFLKAIKVRDDNLTLVDNKVCCHFYRFISLVPLDGMPDNQMDSSCMIGAGFSDLKIFGNDTSDTGEWGINTDRISAAWLTSPERIQLTYYSDSETANIDHWAE